MLDGLNQTSPMNRLTDQSYPLCDAGSQCQKVPQGNLPESARVRTHNQNMTVAARAMAERKISPHLS